MASTTLVIKGSKNPSAIYLRFTEGRAIDVMVKTGLFINPKFWDSKFRKIRNVIDVPNRDELNSKLVKLQIFIIDKYNNDFTNGEIIDKFWLEKNIKEFFNRPVINKTQSEKHTIYLSDFALWWIENKAPKFKVSSNKYMDSKTIGQYEQALNNIKRFEGKNKIKFKSITEDLLDDFSTFLRDNEKYSESTTKRKIGRVKFFCERAKDNIEVNKNYKSRVFVKIQEQQYKEPYLNEEEINRIYKHNFSYDETLDNVRDNLIIGLWTGLRVSDFLTRLDISNIEGDYISIKTLKTNHSVAIPLHPHIKSILKKRNGNLPSKISEVKFNKQIKTIGQIVDIDQEILGGISKVDKKTKIKRKEIAIYKKYMLITSHICRRSFATNLFGKISNSVIMAIAGWKSEQQMLDYVKLTNLENAKVLKEYWDQKY